MDECAVANVAEEAERDVADTEADRSRHRVVQLLVPRDWRQSYVNAANVPRLADVRQSVVPSLERTHAWHESVRNVKRNWLALVWPLK